MKEKAETNGLGRRKSDLRTGRGRGRCAIDIERTIYQYTVRKKYNVVAV